MSWATSSLADRKESEELYKMKGILYRSRNKEVKLGKKWVGYCKVTFLGRTAWLPQADYPASAGQVTHD